MREIVNYCWIHSFKNMPMSPDAVLLTLPLACNYQFQLSINIRHVSSYWPVNTQAYGQQWSNEKAPCVGATVLL